MTALVSATAELGTFPPDTRDAGDRYASHLREAAIENVQWLRHRGLTLERALEQAGVDPKTWENWKTRKWVQ